MELDIPRRWVKLTLGKTREGSIWVGYDDDRGNRRAVPADTSHGQPGWAELTLAPLRRGTARVPVTWPGDGPELVSSALAELPAFREGPHTTGAVPLAVFVDEATEPPPWIATWRGLATRLLVGAGFNPDQLQEVGLGKRMARQAFRLPLRIMPIGGDAFSVAWRIYDLPGLGRRDAEFERYGLQLSFQTDLRSARKALTERSTGIAIVEAALAPGAVRMMRRLTPADSLRPRLLVVLGDGSAPVPALERVPGMSVLTVSVPAERAGGDLVARVVFGIVHDLPLHEALRSALREVPEAETVGDVLGADWLPRLTTTPESNHALRMTTAWAEVVKEVATLEARTNPGDLRRLRRNLTALERQQIVPGLLGDLREVVRHRAPLVEAAGWTQGPIGFGQESQGFRPLATAEALAEGAREAAAAIEERLGRLAADRATTEVLEANQQRRLETRIGRIEYSPLTTQAVPSELYVSSDTTLRAGARYRVEVGIGQQWPATQNLAPSQTPPIDPILPAATSRRGHRLEIVLYEGEFELTGERAHEVWLRPASASQVAEFEIRAPEAPGPASFRVAVYYRDHLVQAIKLFKVVAAEEERRGEAGWSKLEFSRTEKFTNLGTLGKRALSIAVNQKGGSHTFMVKRRGVATTISLSEHTLDKQVERYRAILEQVVHDRTTQEDGVRDLADVGYELGLGLFDRVPSSVKSELRDLRTGSDETLQLVRLDAEYAFPWSIVYDWDRPQKLHGAPAAAVCCGVRANGDPCGHGPDDTDVYCVNGFWGIRHVIEEFLSEDQSQDATNDVTRAPGGPLVVLTDGLGDEYTQKLGTELGHGLAAGDFRPLGPHDTLLDELWDPARRPAACIVIGHMRTKPIENEPDEPRILTGSKERFLRAEPVTVINRKRGSWEQPRTLMLLMACDSATTELAQLSSFVSALSGAGAAAVIGTECEVYSGTAADFARTVVTSMIGRRTRLGAAVRLFRQQAIRQCDPLGFAFTAFGGADVRLVGR